MGSWGEGILPSTSAAGLREVMVVVICQNNYLAKPQSVKTVVKSVTSCRHHDDGDPNNHNARLDIFMGHVWIHPYLVLVFLERTGTMYRPITCQVHHGPFMDLSFSWTGQLNGMIIGMIIHGTCLGYIPSSGFYGTIIDMIIMGHEDIQPG